MKKNWWIILILLSVFLLFSLSLESKAVSGEWKLVVKVKGDVESQRADESVWNKIWQSRMLKDGDKARTLEDSMAKIKLADQSVLLIGSNSLVEISQFKVTDTARTANIKLILGKIRVSVENFLGGTSTFEIKTPNAILAARGTEFYVEQDKAVKQDTSGATKLVVFDGDVLVTTATASFLVKEGQTALINTAGNIFINPQNFPYPHHISPPPQSDESLSNPSTTISEIAPPDSQAPPNIPIFNPGATPVSSPCPAPCPR